MSLLRRTLAVCCATTALLLCAPAGAQPTDETIKAEFLPRFARYVTWPDGKAPRGTDPFVLCIIGNDPFGGTVDKAARAQTIDGRRILVRRMGSAEHADSCHLAFIRGSSSRPIVPILRSIGSRPILTVTDGEGPRGIIHFTMSNGRVRFVINQSEAQARRLAISSRLLALAVGVKQ